MTYYSAPGVKELNVCPKEFNTEMKKEMATNIIKTVTKFYGGDLFYVSRKTREEPYPTIVQMSCYLIQEKVKGLSLKDTSDLFGERYRNKLGKPDHTAIINNRKKIQGYLDINDPIAEDYRTLLKMI